MRSNARYDALVTIHEAHAKEHEEFIRNDSRSRDKLETKHTFSVKGIKGSCVLRSLA